MTPQELHIARVLWAVAEDQKMRGGRYHSTFDLPPNGQHRENGYLVEDRA